MRKLGLLVLAVGLSTTMACSDDKETQVVNTTPTANGVFPASGFLGRKLRVEVSGDATTWTSAATATFGDGITVDQVSLASPTSIFADITILPTATPGMRDVSVTDGSTTVTLTQAFEITSPIEVAWQGTVAQGSVAVFTVINHDFDNPFDDTSTGDGFFTPLVYTNIAFTSPAGVTMSVSSVAAYKIQGVALIDIDAQPGPLDIQSGPPGGTIVDSPLGTNLDVTARTATPLTAGTPIDGNVANAYDTDLYSYQPTGTTTLDTFTSTSTTGGPGVIVLPASGHFSDLIAFAPSVQAVGHGGSYYLINWDNTGTPSYSYSISATSLALNAVDEVEPGNNTAAGAQVATLPFLLNNASMSSSTDQDWVKLTVTAADVTAGKGIHVRTLPGDPLTDTWVDVYGPGNPTAANELGPSDDLDYHEDFTATPTAAGTYFVKIYASSVFDSSHMPYLGLITLE